MATNITLTLNSATSSITLSTGARGPVGPAGTPGDDENYVTDAEKVKLANLSGTNTGDETQASILEKVPIITRTAAEGPPTVPASIEITGDITVDGVTPYTFQRLFYDGQENDRPAYRAGDSAAKYGVNTTVHPTNPVWQLLADETDDGNVWAVEVEDDSPIGLDFDGYGFGTVTGIPVVKAFANTYIVTGDIPSPAFVGQKLIIGDDGEGDDTGNGNRLEYTSLDGSTWTLTGPPNVQADPENAANVIVTTWSGGVPTYTSTPSSSYLTA